MAAADREAGPGAERLAELLRGLAGNRWRLVAGAAILTAMAALGFVGPAVAALLFAAFAVLLVSPAPAHRKEASPAGLLGTAEVPPDVTQFADALPSACFILDRRGVVRHANRRAASAFSIRAGEALTFRLRVPDLVAAFDSVAKGGPPAMVEFSERVPTERWFSAWFAPLAGTEFIVLVLDDQSERRKADKIRVDFVANASHELRTPLASLAGFIETLQGPARDDVQAREKFLKIMQEQAERMSRLVNDLLSLSRIEMKQHVIPSDTVDIVSVVGDVEAALEPLASDLGVTIEVDAPADGVAVKGDRDELVQVFENLIENAAKYGQAGGRVAVGIDAGRGSTGPSVSVRDFGPGIPEEHIPRLTERFYRVDLDASRKHRGTGLGLAIVKHILARHRARMLVESKLGEGATFRVVFPQGESRAASPDEQDI